MVGVLVSDKDRGQTGDALETVGEGARIEQQSRDTELREQA
jgi:hypothetical protein